LNLLINLFLLYKQSVLLFSYFEFEYLVLCLFFSFFILVSVNTLFKSIFSFMTKKYTFNMLFIVQFLAAVLIMQLLGWIFSLYLAFVMMLIYLLIKNENRQFDFFLQMSGITVGGLYLYMVLL
ncbi:MAG TPA: hypothetical protein VD905_20590, partial [Flavobacteriales bacterium]|nr:hypothetical protein [Flavobacteriales bacterium]